MATNLESKLIILHTCNDINKHSYELTK